MNLRPTTSSTYGLVGRGILENQKKLVLAQQRIASGKRILQPSDDPQGTGRAMSLRRQLAEVARFQGAIDGTLPGLQIATSALEDFSGALAQVRALLVQSMSGTASPEDRASIGASVAMLHDQLVGLANSRFGDRYLFGGNQTSTQPYVKGSHGVQYAGDTGMPSVMIGHGSRVGTGLPGSALFNLSGSGSVELTGSTGLTLGKSASQGQGFARIELRHDSTSGAPGSGLALVPGASDTLIGERQLTVDAEAGTVRLGNGQAAVLPQPATGTIVVEDEHGARVHLDLSGYDGTSSTATLTGHGSISLDGGAFQPLDVTDDDVRLVGAGGAVVLHLDATAARRAGEELVTFHGSSSVFDLVAAIANDLSQPGELSAQELLPRLSVFLGELDRHHSQLLEGLGALGARQARMQDAREHLAGIGLQLEGLLSNVEDADLTEVVLEAGRAEQTLQLVQMAGARLIQTSLLNFLR